jgi:hypothetical protein
MSFRRAFAVVGAALVLTFSFSSAVSAQAKPGQAQQQRKLSNDERREYTEVAQFLDEVIAGKQPAPADLKARFQHHFLKSDTGVYLPYTLELSGGTFSSYPVTMYVRAVGKEAAAAPAKPGDKPGDKPAEYPFVDLYFLTEKQLVTANGVTEINRALSLPPGEYTVYFALRERQPRDRKQMPKAVVLSQPLSVPDMNKGLTTSSVILASGLDPAAEQLNAQQQLEQPFNISGYKITPVWSGTFSQANELLFVFFIYNEGAAANGKPDVDVAYNFFRGSEEKPFTRLATQSFNATTLPAEFNLAAGHQVMVGQGVPLKSAAMTFAPGQYRLEIQVTDKTSNQTITRNVPFTVS